MLSPWSSVPVVVLALVSSSLAAKLQSFENTAIVRTVELGGSQVHVTTTYAVKALQPKANVYTIALSALDREKTSWLEAKLKGSSELLPIEEHDYDAEQNFSLLDVTLPSSLGVNGTANIVIDTIQTHATWAWPAEVAQSDEQLLKYRTELFVLSPYRTAVQRTKLKATVPQIISHTEPKGLEDFTRDSVASKSGGTVTYGPYNDIPPSASNKFLEERQQPVTIHYGYDHAVLEVIKLKRAAEISHWGANLNIQDEIQLRNAGPALKGHFSRLEHQSQAYFKRISPQVVPGLSLHLPAGIRDAYYYDKIGNVSTSRLRIAPSVPKGSEVKQYSVFEFRPRYPLLGGWNYTFTLGWDAPLADSASYDKKTGKYIVEIPVMTPVPGAVVNEAEVKIILPEGATDISFVPPFPAITNWMYTYKTYLDTAGRPALSFEYRDLTSKHIQSIYVSYKVPLTAHLRKPIAVASVFFGLFTLALIGRRLDLTIQKQKVL